MIKLLQKRPLGKTGINVPPIIYGTSYLGNLYAALSEETKLEIVRRWFECTEKPVLIDSAGKVDMYPRKVFAFFQERG